MIAHKKKFFSGVGMLVGFAVILAVLFSPVFNGHNGLNYLDSLYNSISKGSAYYIPDVRESTADFSSVSVAVTLVLASETQAKQTAVLLEKGNARVQPVSSTLTMTGSLGGIFKNCLEDADLMYHNNGETVSAKYGMDERLVLYNWHCVLKAMEKELNRQKEFKAAKMVALTVKKAVDLAYNYYRIEPKKIGDSLGIVLFSLIFYVIYTLWFGFSILFMFEGWGMQLDH